MAFWSAESDANLQPPPAQIVIREDNVLPQSSVLGIFKFGKRQYIEAFVKGLLYMNTLERFVKEETDSLRCDPHEGTSNVTRADGSILSMQIESGEFKPIAEINGPIRVRQQESL